jgi:glycosyltransferase involved in cell wall biosynthesis
MSSVDVIVPCYNYGRFLEECVQSVLTQSLTNLRVLIIDDESSDITPEVGRSLMAKDPRVHYVRHQTNIGHIATYNEGLEWASADYLLLLSADDLLAPGSLQRAASTLDQHPEVVLLYGRCVNWNGCVPLSRLDLGTGEPEPVWVIQGNEFIRSACLTGLNTVATPSAVVRTSVQKQIGNYRPHLPHSGDFEMWLRLAAKGSIAFSGAVQAVRRCHENNMSTGFSADPRADYQQRKAAFDSFFAEFDDVLPQAHRLKALSDKALAERAFWAGVSQLCRGRIESGRWLLRFAIMLRPRLRFMPPVLRMIMLPVSCMMRTPGASQRLLSALKHLWNARSRRQALPG